mmetsp:Transcript_59582/g.158548  ORF Transcript_59582/g.158548 Transcript_59582/m.158548 type:complete len:216 (-) Transcript_59582:406-1053(-)
MACSCENVDGAPANGSGPGGGVGVGGTVRLVWLDQSVLRKSTSPSPSSSWRAGRLLYRHLRPRDRERAAPPAGSTLGGGLSSSRIFGCWAGACAPLADGCPASTAARARPKSRSRRTAGEGCTVSQLAGGVRSSSAIRALRTIDGALARPLGRGLGSSSWSFKTASRYLFSSETLYAWAQIARLASVVNFLSPRPHAMPRTVSPPHDSALGSAPK